MSYNPNTEQYEGLYNNFPFAGNYTATVYAMNSDGIISTANTDSIPISDGKDIYEYDDASTSSNSVIINYSKQYHNFHTSQDTDWLKFYAVSGILYSIKVKYLGTGGTMRFELYNQHDLNHFIDFRETSDANNEIPWEWNATESGIYYLKLFPKVFSSDMLYTIEIDRPIGPFPGYFKGVVTDSVSQTPIS